MFIIALETAGERQAFSPCSMRMVRAELGLEECSPTCIQIHPANPRLGSGCRALAGEQWGCGAATWLPPKQQEGLWQRVGAKGGCGGCLG